MTRFGDFTLLEDLGRSAVADRYKAMHATQGGPFFLKVYTRLDPSLHTELIRRCDFLIGKNHPNLARHLGHGTIDGLPFVVSPFLEGIDLAELSKSLLDRRVTIGLESVLLVLADLATGVGALHGFAPAPNGAVGPGTLLGHGDVSLGHVRVGGDGQVWLTGLTTPRGDVPGRLPEGRWDLAGVGALVYDLVPLLRGGAQRPPLPAPLDRVVRRALGIGPSEDRIGPPELVERIGEVGVALKLKPDRAAFAELVRRTVRAVEKRQAEVAGPAPGNAGGGGGGAAAGGGAAPVLGKAPATPSRGTGGVGGGGPGGRSMPADTIPSLDPVDRIPTLEPISMPKAAAVRPPPPSPPRAAAAAPAAAAPPLLELIPLDGPGHESEASTQLLGAAAPPPRAPVRAPVAPPRAPAPITSPGQTLPPGALPRATTPSPVLEPLSSSSSSSSSSPAPAPLVVEPLPLAITLPVGPAFIRPIDTEPDDKPAIIGRVETVGGGPLPPPPSAAPLAPPRGAPASGTAPIGVGVHVGGVHVGGVHAGAALGDDDDLGGGAAAHADDDDLSAPAGAFDDDDSRTPPATSAFEAFPPGGGVIADDDPFAPPPHTDPRATGSFSPRISPRIESGSRLPFGDLPPDVDDDEAVAPPPLADVPRSQGAPPPLPKKGAAKKTLLADPDEPGAAARPSSSSSSSSSSPPRPAPAHAAKEPSSKSPAAAAPPPLATREPSSKSPAAPLAAREPSSKSPAAPPPREASSKSPLAPLDPVEAAGPPRAPSSDELGATVPGMAAVTAAAPKPGAAQSRRGGAQVNPAGPVAAPVMAAHTASSALEERTRDATDPEARASRAAQAMRDPAVRALLARNAITEPALRAAIDEHSLRGGRVVEILVASGVISDAAVADMLADESGRPRLPDAELRARMPSPSLVRRLPQTYVLARRVLPLSLDNGRLTLAMADPFDSPTMEEVKNLLGASQVEALVAARASVTAATVEAYKHLGIGNVPGTTGNATTVLLCTADEAKAARMGARLVQEGMRVEHVVDGGGAKDILQNRPPSVVICAHDLGVINASALLLFAREQPPTAEMPFFIYGPRGDEALATRLLDLGADDFFSEPLKLDVLVSKVRRAARKARGGSAVDDPSLPRIALPNIGSVDDQTPVHALPLPEAPPPPKRTEPTFLENIAMPSLDDLPELPSDFSADTAPDPQPAMPTGVMGTLRQMALPEIVQSLEMGRKTARVDLVPADGEKGMIAFDTGQIRYAECGDLRGDDAFYQLARHKEGFFRIHYGDAPPAVNIEHPTTFLLLEAMRRMDEEGAPPGEGGGSGDPFA